MPHARRHRKKVEVAKRKGWAAPPPPEGLDDEMLDLYDEVMASLTQKVGAPRGGCVCAVHAHSMVQRLDRGRGRPPTPGGCVHEPCAG